MFSKNFPAHLLNKEDEKYHIKQALSSNEFGSYCGSFHFLFL